MKTFLAIVGTVLKKDMLSVLPLVLLAAVVQVFDIVVTRLDLIPHITAQLPFIWFFASTLLIFSVLQLDSPVSVVDDWLCRPVPKRALLLAKVILLLAVLYGARALATFGVDLWLGYSVVEALQDAVLLQMNFRLIAFPLLAIAAIITATLIQGMGLLLAIGVVLVILPSLFMTDPEPLEPGPGDALSDNANGMLWMATAPGKLAALAVMCVSFWVVYRYRHIAAGRALFAGGTVLTLAIMFAPIVPLPWDTVYGVQKAVAPHEAATLDSVAQRLTLHHANACFPATTVDALVGDTVYASARQALGVNAWNEEWLREAGGDGISFITRVQPQGVPRDLRLKLAYVQATYVEGGTGERIALRPAQSITDRTGSGLNHQWLLPQAELERLARGEPSLELTYSFAVLRPLTHELAADGSRRELEGLGYCSATHDELNNRIDVECFNGGDRPALISAQLLDIPSSRVDAAAPDYAPPLIQAPSSSRIELSLGPASLISKPIAEVTAWELAGFIDDSIRSAGILGSSLATCPLPSSTAQPATQLSSWKDDSPHTAFYFSVDDGVQLEVLDWGGAGVPLLLIHGLGATAHTWDDIAPLLAQNHRVVGLTRRGIGGSSRPDSGYDSATLARDATRVLDALSIDRAVIVGSSMGGQELSWLGAEYPQRVAGLIYLDAAFDYAAQQELEFDDPGPLLPPRPPVEPEDVRSYESLRRWMARTDTDPVPEGEMLALYNINNRFLAGNAGLDMRLVDATEAGVQRPRYEAITAPVLALFAMPDGPQYFMKPWYDADDPQLQQTLTNMAAGVTQLKGAARDRFAQLVPAAEVRDLPGAAHGMHMSHRDEVAAEIRRFVETRVKNATVP
jgi:pimeloyl-ACP methyl ester carboxylesterase